MRLSLLITFSILYLSACASGESLGILECSRTYETVNFDDDSLGFTAEQVLSTVNQNLPNHVQWDKATLGQSEASLVVSLGAAEGTVQIATPEAAAGPCFENNAMLIIPITLSIQVEGGDVAISGTALLEAGAASIDRIYLSHSLQDLLTLPTTLTGSYQDSFDAFWTTEAEMDGKTLTGIYASVWGPWSSSGIGVDAHYSSEGNEGGTNYLWGGHWGLP